jgi:hypothetical protein
MFFYYIFFFFNQEKENTAASRRDAEARWSGCDDDMGAGMQWCGQSRPSYR